MCVGPTLLIDGGDISIGTAFSRQYGAVSVGFAMSLAGYSAMALGNHDLEYAAELPKKYFPVLSVNVDGYNRSVVVDVDGIRVGLLAYTNTEYFDIEKVLQAVRREALRLRGFTDSIEEYLRQENRSGGSEKVDSEKVGSQRSGSSTVGDRYVRSSGVTALADVVILIGHGGIMADRYMARHTRGLITAVFGGHSHDLVSCEGLWHSGDAIVHAGTAGMNLGLMTLALDRSHRSDTNSVLAQY